MPRSIAVASLLIPAAVATFALLSASPALAATPANCVETTGARACYNGSLEKLTSDDILEDGHHTRTYFSVGQTTGNFDNFNGNGTRTELYFNGSIPANGTICFRAARMEGDQILNLSARKCLPVT